MAIYPVEFYRRAEEKWKLRYTSSRATPAEQRALKTDGTDDVLTQWPWLEAIGQGLLSQYAVQQRLPKRLVALLKKLSSCGL